MLVVGLSLFGMGEAALVQGRLGVTPWTVLAEGLDRHLGWGVGWTTLLLSVLVLVAWIPLRQEPGSGTVLNALIIAAALEFGVRALPEPHALIGRVLELALGIALIGIGSGLYLTCACGPGPRDGWMTGLHARTGWPVARVRLCVEVTVLSVGWLLGGTVGIGTVAFAVLIGSSVGLGLRAAARVGALPTPA